MDTAPLVQAIESLKERVTLAGQADDKMAVRRALQRFADAFALSTSQTQSTPADGTQRFLVRTESFVWARSPREAAFEARSAHFRPCSMSAVFDVIDEHAHSVRVDLTDPTHDDIQAGKVVRLIPRKRTSR